MTTSVSRTEKKRQRRISSETVKSQESLRRSSMEEYRRRGPKRTRKGSIEKGPNITASPNKKKVWFSETFIRHFSADKAPLVEEQSVQEKDTDEDNMVMLPIEEEPHEMVEALSKEKERSQSMSNKQHEYKLLEMEAMINALKSQLKEKCAQAAKDHTEILAFRTFRDEASSKAKEDGARIAAMGQEVLTLKQDLEAARVSSEEIDSLKAAREEQGEIMMVLCKELDGSKKALKENLLKSTQLEKIIMAKDKALENWNAELQDARVTAQHDKEQIRENEKMIDSLKAEKKALQAKLVVRGRALNALKAELEKALNNTRLDKQKIMSMEKSINSLRSEKDEAQANAIQVQQQLVTMEETIVGFLRSMLDESSAQSKQDEEQIASIDKAMKTFKAELEVARGNTKQTSQLIKSMEEMIYSLKTEMDQVKTRATHDQQQIVAMEEIIRALKREKEEAASNTKQDQQKIAALEESLQDLMAEAPHAQGETREVEDFLFFTTMMGVLSCLFKGS